MLPVYEDVGPVIPFRLSGDKPLGTVAGFEAIYGLSDKGALIAGYSHTANSKEGSFQGSQNGINVYIDLFKVQYKENIYFVGYERQLLKKHRGLRWQFAGYYVQPRSQEIEILGSDITVIERQFRNSRLNELGAFVGLHQQWKIDTHLTFGIMGRFFYVLSAMYASHITLTPTLTYHFNGKKGKMK